MQRALQDAPGRKISLLVTTHTPQPQRKACEPVYNEEKKMIFRVDTTHKGQG